MQDSKPVKVPIHVGVNLFVEQCPTTQEEEEDMSRVACASVFGSLVYVMVFTRPNMVCTRPNIAHAMGVLSRFMSKLRKEHWISVKWYFSYLCGISDYGLCH